MTSQNRIGKKINELKDRVYAGVENWRGDSIDDGPISTHVKLNVILEVLAELHERLDELGAGVETGDDNSRDH